MRVLVLGASGSIGTAVAAELYSQGHSVLALARSDASESRLQTLGYQVIRGDLRAPRQWAHAARSVDAIVQVAATFSSDMGDVDRAVLEALHDAAAAGPTRLRLVYTGGCWLYGATGDAVATEATAFDPIGAFAWMTENAQYLLESDVFSSAVIHPAMVYHREGGVFGRFIEQARGSGPIEIWGSANARWPLVHRDDLAVAYRLLVERRDLIGHFNASAETGVPVGVIARTIAAKFGHSQEIVVRSMEDVVAQHGAWAEGPTLDQQMSSEKLRKAAGWAPAIDDFATSDALSRFGQATS